MLTSEFMRTHTPTQLRAFAIETFREADKDNSGSLDRLELYNALAHGRASISHAMVERLFELMDDDHDGTITEDEFVSGIAEFVLVSEQLSPPRSVVTVASLTTQLQRHSITDTKRPSQTTGSRRHSVTGVTPMTMRRLSVTSPASDAHTYTQSTVSSQIRARKKRAPRVLGV